MDYFSPPYFNTVYAHKFGHNLLLTEAGGVNISKASTRQLAKRNWVSVALVQVSPVPTLTRNLTNSDQL